MSGAIAGLLSLLRSPVAWVVIATLGVVIVLKVVYSKGETAGKTGVTTQVEHTTNVEIDQARKQKERADEKVRDTPLDSVIDSTR